MPAGLRLCLLMLAVWSVPAARAAEPDEDCGTIEQCLAKGPEDLVAFNRFLSARLREWTCPELVDGLQWRDADESRTWHVHTQISFALRSCRLHTTESARTLLQLGLNHLARGEGTPWIAALTEDDVGRWIVAEYLDGTKAHDEKWVVVAARYIESAGTARRERKVDYFPAEVRRRYESPEEQQRLSRYVETLWAAYLEYRVKPTAERRPKDLDLPPIEFTIYELLNQRPEFDERYMTLIRRDVAAGRIPEEAEFSSFAGLRRRHSEVIADLMTWAESPKKSLRFAATVVLSTWLSPDDLQKDGGRGCRLVRALADDTQFSQSQRLIRSLTSCLTGASRAQLTRMLTIARAAGPDDQPNAFVLLMRLGETMEAARTEADRVLFGADLDALFTALSRTGFRPSAWVQTRILKWVRGLSENQLAEPAVQERFIVYSPVLLNMGGTAVRNLPRTRRPPPLNAQTQTFVQLMRRMEDVASANNPNYQRQIPPTPKFELQLRPVSKEEEQNRTKEFVEVWRALKREASGAK